MNERPQTPARRLLVEHSRDGYHVTGYIPASHDGHPVLTGILALLCTIFWGTVFILLAR